MHNSGWVQSPGAKALPSVIEIERLKTYVRWLMDEFGGDRRILAWDLWNEPDNTNHGSYEQVELNNKVALVDSLLPRIFDWVRRKRPSQPLTSGLWRDAWATGAPLSATEKIQVEESDIISFHSYGPPEEFERRVLFLQRYKRPILCTEYMARPRKSTFAVILPIAKRYRVAAINWGLVNGRTQTNLPWDSWEQPYVETQPPVWFHDIFYEDGKPYDPAEVEFIRKIVKGTPGGD